MNSGFSRWLCLVFAAVFVLSSCSKKNDDDSTTTTVVTASTVAGLPKSTAPVVATSTASQKSGQLRTQAQFGLPLSDWASSTLWRSTSSRPFCEVVRTISDVYTSAMLPDKILCYLGAIEANDGTAQAPGDGSYKYLRLNNLSSSPFPPKVKYKMVKNANGAITEFEMFSCFDSNFSGDVTQTEYISHMVTSGETTVLSKRLTLKGGLTYGSETSLSGSLNSENQWTSKTGTMKRHFSGVSGAFEISGGQEVNITQKSDSLVFNAYLTGAQIVGSNSVRDSSAFTGEVQLINAAIPKQLALGDGSVKANFTWCIDANLNGECTPIDTSYWTRSDVSSWNGDSLVPISPASDGTYYAAANSATIPSIGSVPTVSFSEAQKWDCKVPTGSSFTDIDLTQFENAETALGKAIGSCHFQYQLTRPDGTGDLCKGAN